jgi:hypothetical protein
MSELLYALPIFDVGDEPAFGTGTLREANALLGPNHYLGPIGGAKLVVVERRWNAVVGCQVWRHPTARMLPADGSWLELSRWCLTPECGENAGSRMNAYSVKLIRRTMPLVTTLVSYSDPSHGHTGSLYKACNWEYAPTWHRLSPPPTGSGSWRPGEKQEPKDRWLYRVRKATQ